MFWEDIQKLDIMRSILLWSSSENNAIDSIELANNRINDGLAKAAPLRYAAFASRLCGAFGSKKKEVPICKHEAHL